MPHVAGGDEGDRQGIVFKQRAQPLGGPAHAGLLLHEVAGDDHGHRLAEGGGVADVEGQRPVDGLAGDDDVILPRGGDHVVVAPVGVGAGEQVAAEADVGDDGVRVADVADGLQAHALLDVLHKVAQARRRQLDLMPHALAGDLILQPAELLHHIIEDAVGAVHVDVVVVAVDRDAVVDEQRQLLGVDVAAGEPLALVVVAAEEGGLVHEDEVRTDLDGAADDGNGRGDGDEDAGALPVGRGADGHVAGAAVADVGVVGEDRVNDVLNGHGIPPVRKLRRGQRPRWSRDVWLNIRDSFPFPWRRRGPRCR